MLPAGFREGSPIQRANENMLCWGQGQIYILAKCSCNIPVSTTHKYRARYYFLLDDKKIRCVVYSKEESRFWVWILK